MASLSASSVSFLQTTLEQVMLLLEEKRKREGRPENIKVRRKEGWGEGGREGVREREGGRGGTGRQGWREGGREGGG